MSIGEMTTYRPVHGGFIRQAAEYVDPALAFAEGMNFWFQVRYTLKKIFASFNPHLFSA